MMLLCLAGLAGVSGHEWCSYALLGLLVSLPTNGVVGPWLVLLEVSDCGWCCRALLGLLGVSAYESCCILVPTLNSRYGSRPGCVMSVFWDVFVCARKWGASNSEL